MKKIITVYISGFLTLLLCLPLPLYGQETDSGAYTGSPYLSFTLSPGMTVPLADSAELFSPGGNIRLGADYRLFDFLIAQAGLDYNVWPVRSDGRDTVHLLSLSTGAVLDFEVFDKSSLGAFGNFGLYYGFIGGSDPVSSYNPSVEGGLYASYRVLPSLSLGIEASYRRFFGLSSDLSVSLGASYHFYFSSPGILEISNPGLRVFPILFTYYDNHPFSTLSIRNTSDRPVENITVRFFTEEFMINPKLCREPFRLEPGEEQRVCLYALFTEKILSVSEGTKVSAKISADFEFKGKDYCREEIAALDVISRNGIVWDDDRKAACFVTARDTAVLGFSKPVTGMLRNRPVMEFDPHLLKAMVLHCALDLYGLAYVPDPSTPYAEYSKMKSSVDFLQFPNQTLEYRGGDCDDLSILYSALLESLGIETAFITIPGHIFVAFRLSLDEENVRTGFLSTGGFIIRQDGVWIPLEVTSIHEGFLQAWQLGAREWNEAAANREASFYPVHASWEEYEPVGYSGGHISMTLPAAREVLGSFEEELDRLIDRETGPRIAELKKQIAAAPDQIHLRNSLGVLYARCGKLDDALRVFEAILKRETYPPASFNRGNICYLTGQYQMARDSYEQALEKMPDNAHLILALTRVEQKLQNTERALSYYNRLMELDPGLAEKAGIKKEADDTDSRAQNIEAGGVLWQE